MLLWIKADVIFTFPQGSFFIAGLNLIFITAGEWTRSWIVIKITYTQ